MALALEGGCYCKAIRYRFEGEPLWKGQCHCRECQYISGGSPNVVFGLPEAGFTYTEGAPRTFARKDLEKPVSREFCGECGTPILTRSPGAPGLVVLKVGSLDDPSVFEAPQFAIFTIDRQRFHHIPEGVPAFERLPG